MYSRSGYARHAPVSRMRLHVMRHGPAEDRGPSGRDFDRRLTDAGRALVDRAAIALLDLRGAPVPRILSSPLTRAEQTARIVHARAGLDASPVELHDDLGGDDVPLELARQLGAAGEDAL